MKLVKEYIDFQRNVEPKKAMQTGLDGIKLVCPACKKEYFYIWNEAKNKIKISSKRYSFLFECPFCSSNFFTNT